MLFELSERANLRGVALGWAGRQGAVLGLEWRDWDGEGRIV